MIRNLSAVLIGITFVVSCQNAGSQNLIDASTRNDIRRVESLIAAGTDVNLKDKNGVSPLSIASFQGHLEVVKRLLAANANVNADMDALNPLLNAMLGNNREVAKLLINAKADVSAKMPMGGTVLTLASEKGDSEIVRLLLESGIGLKHSDVSDALRVACRSSNLETAKLLLSAKADVNAKNEIGESPLMGAAMSGNIEMVKLLLSAKADFNAKNIFGHTVLDAASAGKNAEIVKLLRAAGAK
jgi:uncharacterized protein